MESSASLADLKVMIVEDDYILAMDTEVALGDAGAEVVGPFPSEDLAIDAIQRETLDAAVIDLNLGFGPTFVVVEELQRSGIPFVILTGYTEALPNELMHLHRMTKPVDTKQVVQRLSEILEARRERLYLQ